MQIVGTMRDRCNLCRSLLDIARTADWWCRIAVDRIAVDRTAAGHTVVGHIHRYCRFDRRMFAVPNIRRMAVRRTSVVPRWHSLSHIIVGWLNCLPIHIRLVHCTPLVVRTAGQCFRADCLRIVAQRLILAALAHMTVCLVRQIHGQRFCRFRCTCSRTGPVIQTFASPWQYCLLCTCRRRFPAVRRILRWILRH